MHGVTHPVWWKLMDFRPAPIVVRKSQWFSYMPNHNSMTSRYDERYGAGCIVIACRIDILFFSFPVSIRDTLWHRPQSARFIIGSLSSRLWFSYVRHSPPAGLFELRLTCHTFSKTVIGRGYIHVYINVCIYEGWTRSEKGKKNNHTYIYIYLKVNKIKEKRIKFLKRKKWSIDGLESSSCWFNLWTVGLHLRITTAAASYANEFPASLATTEGVGAFSFLTSRARLLAAGPAVRLRHW